MVQMSDKAVVDEELMEACLKEITKALLSVRGAASAAALDKALRHRRCPYPPLDNNVVENVQS